MANKTFAAIYVGSSELKMKCYEVSGKKGFKVIDQVAKTIELGRDTYNHGSIKAGTLSDVCDTLAGFKKKMKEYQITEYRAYATSAIREAVNQELVLDHIARTTGINVKVLSNSEQRYMILKGLVAKYDDFHQVVSKNTAFVDIGAGSVQVSLFDKNNLVLTENIHIGAVRIREYLAMSEKAGRYEQAISEYVDSDIATFRNIYLNDKEIKNIIAVGDVAEMAQFVIPELKEKEMITRKQFEKLNRRIITLPPEQLAEKYGIPYEKATLMLPSFIIYESFLNNCKAEEIYVPNVEFCDGIVTSYMDEGSRVVFNHNFEDDIIASAMYLNRRYRCNRAHTDQVANFALALFDGMKKVHGLGRKERLQLHIAAILHECGNYINLNDGAMNSYYIVANSEIIGLTHKERMEIANVIKYNLFFLPSKEKVAVELGQADYIVVAKLAAILRIANVLDKSHTQKIEDINVSISNDKLVISAKTYDDLALETGLFESRADFFEQIYGIRPVLRTRRSENG